MRVLAAIWMAVLATGCGCELDDVALDACAGCTTGPIRHGRFVDDENIEVASSTTGIVARGDRDGGLVVLGKDLAAARTLDIPYDFHDEQEVQAIAVADDGSVAAISYEVEYVDDLDEDIQLRLHYFDPSGSRQWSTLIDREEYSSEERDVVIGPELVFVRDTYGSVRAFSRTSGVQAWKTSFSSVMRSPIVAAPEGGAIVVERSETGALVSLAADMTVQWSLAPAALGLDQVDQFDMVAIASDGTLAVLGSGPYQNQTGNSAQTLLMLDATRNVRWSLPLGGRYSERVSSIATDGERVLVAGDYDGTLAFASSAPPAQETDAFVATVGAAGVEEVRTATGIGTQRAHVAAITAATAFEYITSFAYPGKPQLVLGGVVTEGNGVAILEVAR